MSRKLVLANIAAIAILFCASAAQPASFMISGKGTIAPGACVGQGYADTCRSGTCECLSIPTGKVTGSFKGSSEVFATIDTGLEGSEPTLGCRPMFIRANATLMNKSATKTAVLDITAAYCRSGSFSGGWGVESGATGSGTVSGTRTPVTGKVSMTFRGTVQ